MVRRLAGRQYTCWVSNWFDPQTPRIRGLLFATVVLMGCQYIRGYIVDTIFAGIHFSFTGYFAACGKSYIGFLHNIIAIVLVRVPGSYLASRLFAGTLLPMGLAAPAGSLLSVMICVAAYRWMKRRGTLYTAA